MEKSNESLYGMFQNHTYSQLKNLFKDAKTEDERNFYMELANMSLQKEQKKIISKNNGISNAY